MFIRVSIFIIGFLFILPTYSQKPKTYSSSEIYQAVQKLNFLGTALYIAAHPDDENTQLISYLSNEVKARTAYLSVTRGDGGQNLIGPELRELLGVLRTHELLKARSIDGGEQFFTRANDFGYSKHPDETLDIWNKKEVLSDVIWVIRNFKPDVIINRFDHRSPGTTHGHHTASAMLSVEAFEKANDPSIYSQQLQYTQPWQASRLFFNTSWWFYGSQEKFEQADKSKMVTVDVGTYYPTLGMSNNEIASTARSQHLSQGFGGLTSRGSSMEYLELLKGNVPEDPSKIFEGINTRWTRVKGGKQIENILLPIEKDFNFSNPAIHIPQLLKAYTLIKGLKAPYWRSVKLEQITNIIAACSGLFIDATANSSSAVAGESIKIEVSVLNRSEVPMELSNISIAPTDKEIDIDKKLLNNQLQILDLDFEIPENTPSSNPYWLNEAGSLGMYKAPLLLRGKPLTLAPVHTQIIINIDGVAVSFERDVVYKYALPDKGERYQPFEILPKATVNSAHKVVLFSDQKEKNISVSVRSTADKLQGVVTLEAPENWKITPQQQEITMANKGEVKTVRFRVQPPKEESQATLTPRLSIDQKTYAKEVHSITYDHIPTQHVLLDAAIKAVHLNIQKKGNRIAYIVGAGDAVPESLEQIGYQVSLINPADISKEVLEGFDAVVMGIRAYNIHDVLKFKRHLLFDYIHNGGNLIVQYNTVSRNSNGLTNLAPYPMRLSRERVTDENANVSFLDPEHPLLNSPNKITAEDFNGWVQERGLYFASEWSKEFSPILSMADQGEDPKEGSLLVASYGKGYYIYTGLSFFRELPAGVIGSYKLFANMLSMGKDENKDLNSLNN